jgi:hypothetical protein
LPVGGLKSKAKPRKSFAGVGGITSGDIEADVTITNSGWQKPDVGDVQRMSDGEIDDPEEVAVRRDLACREAAAVLPKSSWMRAFKLRAYVLPDSS